MAVHKKLSFSSFKPLVYIIAFYSLFILYRFHQEGYLGYQEHVKHQKFTSRNPETLEKNETRFQWMEDVAIKTLSTPFTSSVGYINITSYPYIRNEPNKCKEESPFLIFLILTIASEVEMRQVIRSTFGNKTLNNRTSIMCMFLLGKDNKQDPKLIWEESEKYHDIIQKDFQDTYKNLTIKTLMGIEWVCNYCPTANYVMKTDSDMFVNTDRLLELLGPEKAQKQNYFTGYLMANNKPHRNKDSKWHMPHSLYPGDFYPTFCSGTGYVFSGDVSPKILRSSFMVKYVYLEDVFVGLCLEREGIKITRTPGHVFNNYLVAFYPCSYNRIITSHYMTPTKLINYWTVVQENKERCSKSRKN